MSEYDVIRAEVFRKGLEAIAGEMAITLMRTSGSPVVTDAKDFSTTVLDRYVDQVGFSGYVAFHVSTSFLGVQAVMRDYEEDDLAPGDAFLMNDPYTAGAIHQGDCAIAMPYFWRGELVGWGHVNEHVLDVGGSSVSGFAPEARDCFAEALRFPATRIGRDGQIDGEWRRFIANNVRVPGPVLNDLQSMIAAHNTGQARMGAMLDEYGLEEFERYADINKDLSEQAVRSRISQLPDGTYHSSGWVEYDGHGSADLHAVNLATQIEGDTIEFRFAGAPQVDAFINATLPVVLGQTMTTLLCQLLYDVPVNAGLWRPIRFDLGPPGTIVNAVPPAPVTQGHMETGMRINKLVCDTLSQAVMAATEPSLRARVAGEPANGSATTTLAGVDRRTGRPVVMFPMSPPHCQGGGAQTVSDGLDTYGSQCTLGNGVPAVEIEESTAPMMVLWRRMKPNSGGAGITRGGQGISMGIAVVGSDELRGTAFNAVAELPARGSAGGLPGGASHYELLRGSNLFDLMRDGLSPTPERLIGTRDMLPAKTGSLTVHEGDVFLFTSSGGGGLGDPLLRDPEAVAADVRTEKVNGVAAEELYGVRLDAGGDVDHAWTRQLRLARRADRLGSPPRTSPNGDGWLGGVSVDDGQWRCGYCGEALGCSDEPVVDACVSQDTDLAERYDSLAMQVRRRPPSSPQVTLREHYCPGCGYCVTVQVDLAESVRPSSTSTADGRPPSSTNGVRNA